MQTIFIIGILIFTGFIIGEFARKAGFPKVSGFILAGILLNPQICPFIDDSFISKTEFVNNLALCFITFSVGGTLKYSKLKKYGKNMFSITLCEGEFAFIFVALAFIFISPLLIHKPGFEWTTTFIPMSLLIAALAAPTDPSAILAVTHEYKAKGEVSSTILGVVAFDDVLGIMNYSIAVVIAKILVSHQSIGPGSMILKPMLIIAGSILLGILFGILFNLCTKYVNKETEGVIIVLITSLLALAFGTATLTGADELLSTTIMGVVVVNYNKISDKIFKMLERYTDELIFVLFFTLSGMHLKFNVLSGSVLLILLFAIFRIFGKYIGVMLGASAVNAPNPVKNSRSED